jgi:hypothetical protein
VGILPRAPEGFRFLFVGVDTFTKWMEATLVVNITQEATVKFLQSIIYRFGVRKRVLTDNGTQFKGAKFSKCCADFGIDHQPSSAAHPQIFIRARGPLVASAHEVDTAQVRVLIGCVFVEIVIDSETCHICRAVLLTI